MAEAHTSESFPRLLKRLPGVCLCVCVGALRLQAGVRRNASKAFVMVLLHEGKAIDAERDNARRHHLAFCFGCVWTIRAHCVLCSEVYTMHQHTV